MPRWCDDGLNCGDPCQGGESSMDRNTHIKHIFQQWPLLNSLLVLFHLLFPCSEWQWYCCTFSAAIRNLSLNLNDFGSQWVIVSSLRWTQVPPTAYPSPHTFFPVLGWGGGWLESDSQICMTMLAFCRFAQSVYENFMEIYYLHFYWGRQQQLSEVTYVFEKIVMLMNKNLIPLIFEIQELDFHEELSSVPAN